MAEPESGTIQLTLDPGETPVRLDVYLARRLGLSRAQTRRLLADGGVSLRGRPLDESAKGHPLAPGDRVDVSGFVHPSDYRLTPEPEAPLSVLAHGEDWLAADKPAGQAVHPLRIGERGSLLAAVAACRPEIEGVGEGGLRSGVVHRLDVQTSGAVLFATRQKRWDALREAFRSHRLEKHYRAIVLGHPDDEGRADLPLGVASHKPARVRVVAGGTRVSRLAWRVLERFDAACLVEVALETGFLHQIRASFEQLGCPVAGDEVYRDSNSPDPTGAPRQMLHCARLLFEDVRAESPDPPDFAALLRKLRVE